MRVNPPSGASGAGESALGQCQCLCSSPHATLRCSYSLHSPRLPFHSCVFTLAQTTEPSGTHVESRPWIPCGLIRLVGHPVRMNPHLGSATACVLLAMQVSRSSCARHSSRAPLHLHVFMHAQQTEPSAANVESRPWIPSGLIRLVGHPVRVHPRLGRASAYVLLPVAVCRSSFSRRCPQSLYTHTFSCLPRNLNLWTHM